MAIKIIKKLIKIPVKNHWLLIQAKDLNDKNWLEKKENESF